MTTLFDRLKPEIKTLLEKEKESFPDRVEDMYDNLKTTYYVIDMSYGTALQLKGLEGMRDTSPFDMFLNG